MAPPATPTITTIRQRLSVERLASYDIEAEGDAALCLRIYEWNTDISAAFYALLQNVEVVLRNALHDQLTVWHNRRGLSGSWFDGRNVLDARGNADVAAARRRIVGRGRPVTPGRVVAELPFGFWRYLLTSRYEQALWTQALRHAFPGLRPQRRRVIAQRVERSTTCGTGSRITSRSTGETWPRITPTR